MTQMRNRPGVASGAASELMTASTTSVTDPPDLPHARAYAGPPCRGRRLWLVVVLTCPRCGTTHAHRVGETPRPMFSPPRRQGVPGHRPVVPARPRPAPQASKEPSMTPAIDRVVDALRDTTGLVRQSGGQWQARRPAHEDRNPSLSVRPIEGTGAGALPRRMPPGRRARRART